MIRNKFDLKLCHSLIIGVLIYLIFFFTVGQVINSWNSWNLSREVETEKVCTTEYFWKHAANIFQ